MVHRHTRKTNRHKPTEEIGTKHNLSSQRLKFKVLPWILVLGLASTGCGKSRPGITSSPALSDKEKAVRERAPVSSESAVVAAYNGFFSGVDRALQAPPDQVREVLADFTAGSYLDFEIRQVVDHQAQGLEPWGRPIVHVTAVELGPATATVHDCQDASHAGLADARTHRLVPQSRGDAHRNLVAYLSLGKDHRWRLTDLIQHPAACRPS